MRCYFSLWIPIAASVACLAPSFEARAQQPATPAPETDSLTADQALGEALAIVRRLADGGSEDEWDDVSSRMDRYMGILQAKDPSNPWINYLYGWIYGIGGQKGDAIEHAQKFVETREGRNEWLAHRLLGDLLVDQFPRLAASHYKKAANLIDREPSVLYGQSRCALATGDVSEAVRLAREAVDADRSGAVRYLSHLARMLISDRRWAEARRVAETALDRSLTDHRSDPGAAKPLKLADIQYQILIEIAQAEINDSPSPDAYVRIAEYLDQRADIAARLQRSEIARLLKVAISEPGGDSHVPLHERYAVTLAELDRNEEAIAAFDRVLVLDPSNQTARDWLARLRPEPNAEQPQSNDSVAP